MTDKEILKITSGNVALTIVDNILFIGANDDESAKLDVTFQWSGGVLCVGDYKITAAMVEVLKLYINNQI